MIPSLLFALTVPVSVVEPSTNQSSRKAATSALALDGVLPLSLCTCQSVQPSVWHAVHPVATLASCRSERHRQGATSPSCGSDDLAQLRLLCTLTGRSCTACRIHSTPIWGMQTPLCTAAVPRLSEQLCGAAFSSAFLGGGHPICAKMWTAPGVWL